MWVFDGEDWVEEGTSGMPKTAGMTRPEFDPRDFDLYYQPELQIVEVPLTRPEEPPPLIPMTIP